MEANVTFNTIVLIDFGFNSLCQTVYLVNIVYLLAIVSLFGCISNAFNIYVFLLQGFRDRVNMSLFALAVSDIGTCLTAVSFSVCSNPLLISAGLPVAFYEVQNVLGAFPRATCSRITNCITTYIALERCLCIVFPIQIKRIITTRVTFITLTLIFVTLSVTLIPPYLVMNLGWRFDNLFNSTIFGYVSPYAGIYINMNAILTLHTCIQLASFVLIASFTFVLTSELRKQSSWRQTAINEADRFTQRAKAKMERTIRLVTAMTVIYLACYTISIGHLVYCLLDPSYGGFSASYGMYWAVLSTAMVLESVHASVGIFLYYNMSAKYRRTFNRLMLSCNRTNGINFTRSGPPNTVIRST